MNASVAKEIQLNAWLADEISPDLLMIPLTGEAAVEVVDTLKREADRYWSINPNDSLKYADRIIAIARARKDASQEALGLMARGDALKFLGNLQEAWEMLERSGNMYQAIGDEVGWARTRIGRLFLGPDLKRVDETLADVERARTIFQTWNEQEKLLRLDINTAYIHTVLGNQHQALHLYRSALDLAEGLGNAGEPYLGMLHMNIGYVYEAFGDFPQALVYYEKARSHFRARNETRNIVNIEKNLACIALSQGHYRSALQRLNTIPLPELDKLPRENNHVRHTLAECYLNLNRYHEARDLAQDVLEGYRSFNDSYKTARALLHLATAEVELGNFADAQSALDEAATIFTSLGSLSWGMIARLWHGQVAFKQGNFELAWHEAQTAAECFETQDQQVNYATACVLSGQVALVRKDIVSADLYGRHALQVAQHYNIPSLRYAAHLLLGRVAKAHSQPVRAARRFRAAAATIGRVQRGLTITMRSGFLENKGDAWRELIGLHLERGQTDQAFDALEQAKSQVLVNYLANREQFRWSREEQESAALIEELERLRAEHQVFYHLAFNPPREQDVTDPVALEEMREEAATRERQIRAITEKLYLLSHSDNTTDSAFSSLLPQIQASIDEHSVLLEFYDDGLQLWAFVLDGQTCDVQRLPVNVEALHQLLDQLRSNISAALSLQPGSASAKLLTKTAQRLLQRLYILLIEPLGIRRYAPERIIVVPYGTLHYLPFHLLYDGTRYLIENYEVVTLPAASLVTRSGPSRPPGAMIISHSWDGRLPHTLTESKMVREMFGGVLHAEGDATRSALQAMPSQILHIATHGQHRLDQPELSFIELADGQMYADDLLQQDLSYELVTLSACETGRAKVAADEELIGIGRGLLYAGAGALILSLWRVSDTSTFTLMELFYRALRDGKSKAASLRDAQKTILANHRDLHPAFWGAFQLTGDARPLSVIHE